MPAGATNVALAQPSGRYERSEGFLLADGIAPAVACCSTYLRYSQEILSPKRTMTVSEALRQKLRETDDTLYRVAKDTGISWGALNRFLRGSGMRSEQIDKLAAYFGMTLIEEKRQSKKK